MNARLLSICILFVGCTTGKSSKEPGAFTAEDRKFFKEAEAQADAVMAKPDPKGGGYLQMGQFYLGAKKLNLAERMFQKAIESDPKSVPAHAGLAQCHVAAGRTDQAAAALDKGFAIQPKSAILWNEAAVLRANTGDMEGAIEAAEQALALEPKSELYTENLGNFLAVSGQYKRAMDAYLKTMGRGEAHYRIGMVLKDKGDVRGAERQLKESLAEQPDHAAARKLLAAMQGVDESVQRASYETPDRKARSSMPTRNRR